MATSTVIAFRDAADAVAIRLTADAGCLPPEQIRQFLRETERLGPDTARRTSEQ